MDYCKCCEGCLSKNSIANAASAVSPAVVNLSTSVEGGESFGSGTIVNPDGWILTCAHVVVDCIDGKYYSKGIVTVKLQDGRNFYGYVIHVDCQSDVAIMKLNNNTQLPYAMLGKSAQLRPGDWVVAVGCPLNLQNTVTAGIVSCVNRKGGDIVGLNAADREFIQTDCAINEGNSGGPLVNLDGAIVGLNVLTIMQADGLSFAVPIDVVEKIIKYFFKQGRRVGPSLGLTLLEINAVAISQLKEKYVEFPNIVSGVHVIGVTPGSPGGDAGFCIDDVIVLLDGKEVKTINEMKNIIGGKVGVPLTVVVARQSGLACLLLQKAVTATR